MSSRLNIENSIWSDPRFMRLCIALGDEFKAVGAVVVAWRTAQRFWCPDKKPIPPFDWVQSKLPNQLIEVGLAREVEGGVYICGSEEHFDWWFKKQEAGKRGGVASAQARKARSGTAVPKNARNRSNASKTTEAPPKQHSSTTSVATEPSSSSSFSYRSLDIKKDRDQGEQQLAPARSQETTNQKMFLVIKAYCEAFKERYGVRPLIGPKERGIIKRFVEATSAEHATHLIQVYVQMDDRWFMEKHHDLASFSSNITKIQVALHNGKESVNYKPVNWDFVFGGKK